MIVGIESPLSADTDQGFADNMRYARWCCRDASLNHGGIPYASHLFFPQFLDDRVEHERRLGMQMGEHFYQQCDERWFYVDTIPRVEEAQDNGLCNVWRAGIGYQFSGGMLKAWNSAGYQRVERKIVWLPSDMLAAFHRGEEPPRT